ncbi:molybdate ABC transporter permease subunit [Desulfurobacterium atlanticum]|uniref:Molybdenum transport system permease n=1 Tax=Desulfurobacterium atlanticum TaxID=240169 RepID=A0A238YR88_9BACT|nr:molybdate ABC transporter permease subunit [Desulfurobacterium atlanticum]SNR73113.1 molybdate transport system permease protein [Desulfurobacterium atlanticum]
MVLDQEALFSIKLSLQVAFVSTIFVFILGLPLAYLFSLKNFAGKTFLDSVVMLPVVFPPTVTGYILLLIFGRNAFLGSVLEKVFNLSFIFNWKGAVLASFVASFPLFFKSAKAAFDAVDRTFIKASYIFGKGRIETFFKVVLPLSKRGIFSGLILAFARAMGEFGATLMIAGNIPFKTNTIPLEIYTAVSSAEFRKANFLTVVTAVISISVIFLVNRISEKGK